MHNFTFSQRVPSKAGMVVYADYLSTQEAGEGGCQEWEASLGYLVNSRPCRSTQ